MPTGTPLPPQTEGRDGGKSRRGLRNDGDAWEKSLSKD